MDENLDLGDLTAPLRNDAHSGAAEIARAAADAFRRAASELAADTPSELRRGVLRVGLALLEAQPTMAPLVALVAAVLDAVASSPDVAHGRDAATRAAEAFAHGLIERATRTAARAQTLLPSAGSILTLSWSSTVHDALAGLAGRRDVDVFVLESRPLQEGRRMAAALAKEGVAVTVAVDAAGATLIPHCDVVILGADSVGDAGVVNKVGSLAVAIAAREAGVPTHVLADTTKFLPPGFPQNPRDPRPPREVWRAPAGVGIWNQYFEVVPLSLVASVVTEAATLTPREVEERRLGLWVPEEVRAWAAQRR